MKYLSTLILFAITSSGVLCQAQQVDISNALEVEVNQYNQVYYRHKIKKEETLYSLSRFFKVPVSDLLIVNDMKKGDNIPIGATIVIPINTSEIQTAINKENSKWLPLVYTVKKQETLYKISTVYFPQKRENLSSRNNISSFVLSRGRKLVIGWWGEAEAKKTDLSESIKDKIKRKLLERKKKGNTKPNTGVPTRIEVITPSLEEDIDSILSEILTEEENETEIDIDSIQRTEEPEINYKPGIAIWDKAGIDRENLFVMHNHAKLNSYIRLRYSVTGKEVTAQVISTIPNGIFEDDIEIVISPAVAIALGALDSRFQIEMDYYK